MTTRLSRRRFLQTASAMSVLGAGSPFALNLATMTAASAQALPDYRAIVCLFMFGGNDHTNTIIPYDLAEHTDYFNARSSIALDRTALTATAVGPVAAQGGRSFAFHPALTAFKQQYDAGKLAVVANVGPLVVPTTKAQYQARSVSLPPKLFSHNDQQSVWQANSPTGEGARLGWGGRMGDLLAAQNTDSIFTCISASGNALLLSGQNVIQYQVSSSGAVNFSALSGSLFGSASAGTAYRRILTRTTASHLFENEVSKVTTRSIDANEKLRVALQTAPVFTTATPANNSLASQLNVVAKMIAVRDTLGAKRQVFFVSFGGFDNHDFLIDQHNQRMQTMNAAVSAFNSWMQELTIQNNVTLFTASDFGRTLTSNGDGSDHGWGAHHFVLGGAVTGGNVYGTFPVVRFGTNDDVGQGSLLPTTSVDQYAGTLGRWLGLSNTNVATVLPNFNNFGTSPYLGFLP